MPPASLALSLSAGKLFPVPVLFFPFSLSILPVVLSLSLSVVLSLSFSVFARRSPIATPSPVLTTILRRRSHKSDLAFRLSPVSPRVSLPPEFFLSFVPPFLLRPFTPFVSPPFQLCLRCDCTPISRPRPSPWTFPCSVRFPLYPLPVYHRRPPPRSDSVATAFFRLAWRASSMHFARTTPVAVLAQVCARCCVLFALRDFLPRTGPRSPRRCWNGKHGFRGSGCHSTLVPRLALFLLVT